ncbi:amino acid transporter [Secundilactobacillus kimchicus JCM 15530]|uniref:Amino acid transporter n=1 Tax=Secundilactobacillus kimchicus JCM 15530 TaxID=1302272 RepID=A0A0R1HYJ8_9LACO|nr:amino acid permease [Secundilactobacillus kimchicus]KRK48996.1 amino acid transporter [Secundilactobacillus kimchicus JCM 15530]
MKSQPSLKREIGLFSALSTVMGTVIGGGVFFKVAAVVGATQSTSLTLLAWVLGGLLTLCGGLSAAELAAAIPKTGGAIKYLEYTYGKLPGFLMGWALILVYYPANIAALSIIFSTQVLNLFNLSAIWHIPIAVACAASLAGLNFLGARVGGAFQSIALIFKLIPLAIIVIFGLLAPSNVAVSLWPVSAGAHLDFWHAFSSGLLATMFAYDGWISIGNIAGEMKSPEKDLPKAIIGGLTLITLIYAIVNFVFLKTLPLDQLAGNQNAASQAAQVIFGPAGGKLVTVGILISVYGAINGYTLTGMRIPFAMASEDALPFSQQLKKLSPHTYVPYFAGLVQLGISLLMIFMGSFDTLTDMLVFVMWIFNVMLFVALFVLRRREPQLKRPYRVPGYPIIPIIAIIGGLFIVVVTIVTQTGLALVGVGLTLLGIPVYYGHRYRN